MRERKVIEDAAWRFVETDVDTTHRRVTGAILEVLLDIRDLLQAKDETT